MTECDSAGLVLADALIHWISIDRRARLILDQNLQVKWSNQFALAALQATDMIAISDDRLEIRDQSVRRKLREAMRKLPESPVPVFVGDHPFEPEFVLLLTDILPEADEKIVGVEIIHQKLNARRGFAGLKQVFSLTTSEFRVLDQLIDGLSALEIARSQDVSIDTIRTHIRQIYAKVGCSTREALFAKIYKFHSF